MEEIEYTNFLFNYLDSTGDYLEVYEKNYKFIDKTISDTIIEIKNELRLAKLKRLQK